MPREDEEDHQRRGWFADAAPEAVFFAVDDPVTRRSVHDARPAGPSPAR